MKNWLSEKIYRPLLSSISENQSPVAEIALGVALGIFWALVPVVGIQLYALGVN